MAKISFMSACMQFFGTREGQTKLQFGQEVKMLTQEDRAELAPGLAAHFSQAMGEKVEIEGYSS